VALNRSDLDQAVRYLHHARVLLEALRGSRTRALRSVLDLRIGHLSPGDYAADAAAEIPALRDVAGKLSGEARTDVLRLLRSLRITGSPGPVVAQRSTLNSL
jgi:hypothetical protein